MKFLPEVGAGTRILKVKLPGFDNVRIPRKKDPQRLQTGRHAFEILTTRNLTKSMEKR